MGVCRLCLQIIDGTGICNPEETIQTLQKFLPHMNRTLRNTPVICETCLENITTADTFLKSKTETDLKILKELRRLKKNKIDLRQFHSNLNISSTVGICRICLKLMNKPTIFLCENVTNILPHGFIRSMLKFCNVNMNLEVSEKPVMCSNCWEHLQITYSFKKEYLEVERKIRTYCQEFGLPKKNLSIETLQKVQNYFSDEYCEIITPKIKKENDFNENLCSNATKDKKRHIKTEYRLDFSNKSVSFKKKDNFSLMRIYYEVTNNEQEFLPGYWKMIADKWAELRPDKPVPLQRLGSQLQRVLCQKLLTKTQLEKLKAEVDAKRGQQIQKSQEVLHHSDSDDSFSEEAVHSSFTPRVKSEPLSENEIEFNTFEPKLEMESDCESLSLPELERMDLPPLSFKIENICSLNVKREAFDVYMRQEEDISKQGTGTEGLNQSRREGLRGRKEPLKCSQCNFETRFQWSAERHKKMHERGNNLFHQCTYCPYRIASKWLFRRHMKTHKEEEEIPVLQPSVY